MNLQLVIAQAQEAARNKYATAHVNAAHARLIAGLIENPPPAFSFYSNADEFENAAALVEKKIAPLIDEWLHAIAVEARANSTSHFSVTDRVTLLSDALDDNAFGADLRSEAYRRREDALEAAE